jgi:hypothetical protein
MKCQTSVYGRGKVHHAQPKALHKAVAYGWILLWHEVPSKAAARARLNTMFPTLRCVMLLSLFPIHLHLTSTTKRCRPRVVAFRYLGLHMTLPVSLTGCQLLVIIQQRLGKRKPDKSHSESTRAILDAPLRVLRRYSSCVYR